MTLDPHLQMRTKKSLSINLYKIQIGLLEWHSHHNSCLYVDMRISNMKDVAGYSLTIIMKNKQQQKECSVYFLVRRFYE